MSVRCIAAAARARNQAAQERGACRQCPGARSGRPRGPPASGKRAACSNGLLPGAAAWLWCRTRRASSPPHRAPHPRAPAWLTGAALLCRQSLLVLFCAGTRSAQRPAFRASCAPVQRAWRRLRPRPLAWRMRRRGLRRCWRRKDRSRPSRHAPPRPALPPRTARLVASCGSRAVCLRSRSARAALRATSQEGCL
jgi:hypothetical protein